MLSTHSGNSNSNSSGGGSGGGGRRRIAMVLCAILLVLFLHDDLATLINQYNDNKNAKGAVGEARGNRRVWAARWLPSVPYGEAFFGDFGGGGGGGRRPKRNTENDVDYYKVLELSAASSLDITDQDIKRAYRRLSRKYHPDVAASEAERERFNLINRAYEVLSDRKKRKMFDMRGEEGLEQLKEAEANPHNRGNPFAALFGMRSDDGVKAQDLHLNIEVPLSFFFTGGVANVTYEKQVVCRSCHGSGAAPGSTPQRCSHCGGQGVLVSRLQLAPGMFQNVQQRCPHCQGEGERPGKLCPVCKGRRVLPRTPVKVAVEIEAGMEEGRELLYELEGEELPDRLPGNLHLRLGTQPHPVFTRRRNQLDLDMKLRITLREALLGFRRTQRHLDDLETFEIANPAGEVTQHGEVLKIEGKGMPKHNFPSERGDLYVTVEVEMPYALTEEQRRAVDAILPRDTPAESTPPPPE